MARYVALGLALLLLAGGCGDAKQDATKPAPGVATTAAVDGGTPTSFASAKPTTARPASPRSGTPGTPAPNRPNEDEQLATIDAAAAGQPGLFAGVLLAAGPASALVLDVRVGTGASADPSATSALEQLLASQAGKSVSVSGPVALRGVAGGTHTAAEIRALADSQGTPNRAGVAVVHVLYLAGRFENDGVLGVSVRGDTMAIFTDAIDASTSPFVTEARLERAVTTHEMGHLLGLVDLYLNDNRADPQHPGHSTNRGSVMYWAVETSLVGQVLGGPPPVDFDSNDLADLRRIHNGAAPA